MLERLDTLIAFATVLLGVSLLITILNQMINALLGHRGTYLKDGLKDLLETLDPGLTAHAETIANDVLTHKLASDSIFARIDIKWLPQWLVQRWKLANSIRPEELTKLLERVATGKPYQANIETILQQINPTVERDAKLIVDTLTKVAPTAIPSAEQLIKEISDKATKAVGRLEAGFNSTLDRIRQRFTLQMRIWTIVFSLIFAFVYHLDAKKIYSQLATDPTLRASLSSVSDSLMKTYVDVQPQAGAAPQQPLSQEELKARTKKLEQAYKDVRDKLSGTKLALLEVPDPWYCWKQEELFGILAMAALLSLGAPFWYNALKNLVNLRSQVAQKQDEKAKA